MQYSVLISQLSSVHLKICSFLTHVILLSVNSGRYGQHREGDDRLAKKWDERQGGGDAFTDTIDWSKPLAKDEGLEK